VDLDIIKKFKIGGQGNESRAASQPIAGKPAPTRSFAP